MSNKILNFVDCTYEDLEKAILRNQNRSIFMHKWPNGVTEIRISPSFEDLKAGHKDYILLQVLTVDGVFSSKEDSPVVQNLPPDTDWGFDV